MSLPIRLLSEAPAEFKEGTDWYEQQQSGLDRSLIVPVREALDRIVVDP